MKDKIKAILAHLYLERAAVKTTLSNLKDLLDDSEVNILLDKLLELNYNIEAFEEELKNL